MTTDVYKQLASFLDDLPAGFPTTDSGVELRILRRLFTPEEAELFLHLTLLPEPPRVIAYRAHQPVAETRRRLQEMERKGLIYAVHEGGQEAQYMAIHWAIGMYEFQVNRLDAELVRDLEEYMPTWFDQSAWDKVPQLRTIPIGESISAQTEVMPYERAEVLVRAHDRLAVAPCICRKERHLAGEGCDRPLETCLVMGTAASYYVQTGKGRPIDQAEAMAILAQCEREALVLQPGNARDAANICACCGCCCGVLRNIKRYPRPAAMVGSAFLAALNAETCSGCGTCETRCQMQAIHLGDGRAVLDEDCCIGCGLCVTTCPTQSLSLRRKPAAEQPYLPKDVIDTNVKLGQARGKLTTAGLMRMVARSKVDRLLAPKE